MKTHKYSVVPLLNSWCQILISPFNYLLSAVTRSVSCWSVWFYWFSVEEPSSRTMKWVLIIIFECLRPEWCHNSRTTCIFNLLIIVQQLVRLALAALNWLPHSMVLFPLGMEEDEFRKIDWKHIGSWSHFCFQLRQAVCVLWAQDLEHVVHTCSCLLLLFYMHRYVLK